MRVPCLLLLLPCLGGCFAPRPQETKWPPADFFIEVKAGQNTVNGIFWDKEVQIWKDGLVVYREALGDPLISKEENSPGLPVYKAVCAYRLAPESIRMLSRMLYQSSIKDIPERVGDPRKGMGRQLTVLYRSNSNDQKISVHGRIFGPMNRVLHILNSFLPEGHGLRTRDLLGTPEERHVVEVPPVAESVEGALGFHLKMLRMKRFSEAAVAKDVPMHNRRYDLQRDAFALACVHGNIPVAEELLGQMAKVLADEQKTNQPFPDTKVDNIEHLRQILAAARHGARPVTNR